MNTKVGRVLRGAFLLILMLLMWNAAVDRMGSQARAQERVRQENTQLNNEHRLSDLESKLDMIAARQDSLYRKLDDLSRYDMLKLLAISGLLGEAGVRTMRRRYQ